MRQYRVAHMRCASDTWPDVDHQFDDYSGTIGDVYLGSLAIDKKATCMTRPPIRGCCFGSCPNEVRSSQFLFRISSDNWLAIPATADRFVSISTASLTLRLIHRNRKYQHSSESDRDREPMLIETQRDTDGGTVPPPKRPGRVAYHPLDPTCLLDFPHRNTTTRTPPNPLRPSLIMPPKTKSRAVRRTSSGT